MKVLLVDDHSLFLEGVRNFLLVNDIEVVGTAKNGVEALARIGVLQPELILMDVQMAECDGIEATRLIKAQYPHVKIVMLTASEDEDSLFSAIQAGAEGYLLKSMETEQFIGQLNRLKEGDMPLAPGLAKRLLQEFNSRRQTEDKNSTATEQQLSERQLTERQTQILQLLAEGLTYRVMAKRLVLKEVTIKYHIKEILTKLHLTNRTQLLMYASRMELNEDK